MRIKSYWAGDDAVCIWHPEARFCGGAPHVLYGGTIASLLDCHSVNLVVAREYRAEGREIGAEPRIACVSANLNINFRVPVPIDKPVELRAAVRSSEGRKHWVTCSLAVDGRVCADGEVLVVRLKND
jgi:hypothetical protein